MKMLSPPKQIFSGHEICPDGKLILVKMMTLLQLGGKRQKKSGRKPAQLQLLGMVTLPPTKAAPEACKNASLEAVLSFLRLLFSYLPLAKLLSPIPSIASGLAAPLAPYWKNLQLK
ncbi:MAG: hypothetical protein HQL69_23785 [Magnetococcales bacterium]|nr:hypothetical protein [Magnetococcales bacterium]